MSFVSFSLYFLRRQTESVCGQACIFFRALGSSENLGGQGVMWRALSPPFVEIGICKNFGGHGPPGHHGPDSPVFRSGRCKFLWRFKVYYILLIRIMRKQIRCKWRSSSRSNEGNKVMYMPQNGLMRFLKEYCKNDLSCFLDILIDHYCFLGILNSRSGDIALYQQWLYFYTILFYQCFRRFLWKFRLLQK